MDVLVANVDGIKFEIETLLEQQYGTLYLPFAGMDKSTAGVCTFFPLGQCDKGPYCPYRHIRGDRSIVCKHWLRGLCKKGDQCEFLHEYDMTKMPECYFYSRFNACHNKECPFLHIDPESKLKDCPWYDRGFCRHGPSCRHRHARRVLCLNYLAGFCPEGPDCKYMHPKFELPALTDRKDGNVQKVLEKKDQSAANITCHFCMETGHKALHCDKMTPEQRAEQARIENEPFFKKFTMQTKIGKMYMRQILVQAGTVESGESTEVEGEARQMNRNPMMENAAERSRLFRSRPKPLDEVTCFKCGVKGHYANRCPKGHLAFLSKANFPETDQNTRNEQG